MSDFGSDLQPFELGYPGTDLRRKLVDAVFAGAKTATASLREEYAPYTDESLPEVGDRQVMLDFDNRAVAVIGVTEIRVLPAAEVDLAFARDEGEGFETVEEWRLAHEDFWRGFEIRDDTLVVAERFKLVERF